MPRRTRSFGLLPLLLLTAGCDGSDAPEGPRPPASGDLPRLIALGTVQDGGLPHASCRCERCSAAAATPQRKRHVASLGLWLPRSDRAYLIDATPDVRVQLDRLRTLRGGPAEGIDRAPLDGVLLTHAHIGHYTGLAFFGFEAVHTRELAVYCSRSMAGFLRNNGPWSQLVEMRNIDLRELSPGEAVDLGDDVRVRPLSVPHRDEYSDTLGFYVQGPRSTVLYVPDTDPWRAWDPPLLDALEGVDVAILDGAFYSAEELPGRDLASIGHPLMTDSMDRLEARVRAGTLRVYFTHLNHSNPALDPDGPERAEIERRGFAVLAEGQQLPL